MLYVMLFLRESGATNMPQNYVYTYVVSLEFTHLLARNRLIQFAIQFCYVWVHKLHLQLNVTCAVGSLFFCC